MSVIIDGTAGITFPVTAGSASAVQASSGRVLQVVSVYYGTTASTTSGSYVDTGLTASITPSSSTSKILVMVSHGTPIKVNASTDLNMRLVRNSTAIWEFGADMLNVGVSPVSNYGTTATIQYLDSPATTSSTTYKTQFLNGQNNGNTVYAHISGSSITLMEIAA